MFTSLVLLLPSHEQDVCIQETSKHCKVFQDLLLHLSYRKDLH